MLPNWHKKSFHSGVLVCLPTYSCPRVTLMTISLVIIKDTLVVGAHGVPLGCLLPMACGQLPVKTAVDVSDSDML